MARIKSKLVKSLALTWRARWSRRIEFLARICSVPGGEPRQAGGEVRLEQEQTHGGRRGSPRGSRRCRSCQSCGTCQHSLLCGRCGGRRPRPLESLWWVGVSGAAGLGGALGGARTANVPETHKQDGDGVGIGVAGHVDVGVGGCWAGGAGCRGHFEGGDGCFGWGLRMSECWWRAGYLHSRAARYRGTWCQDH